MLINHLGHTKSTLHYSSQCHVNFSYSDSYLKIYKTIIHTISMIIAPFCRTLPSEIGYEKIANGLQENGITALVIVGGFEASTVFGIPLIILNLLKFVHLLIFYAMNIKVRRKGFKIILVFEFWLMSQ